MSENLKRKRIFLEEENFDILSVLNSSHSQAQKAYEELNKSTNNSNAASPVAYKVFKFLFLHIIN